MDELNVQKLYVRFFDVDMKNNEAIPIGEINIKEKNIQQEIIPVVFITNDVFKNLDKNKIEDLAKHIKQEIEFIYPKISDKKIKEIQFDCDWTISTRSKYFYLLNIVEKQNPTLLVSATIRLHQIKDKTKTGIPPIKKGVLMYYATSNPLDFKEENSILENKLAENYCKEIQNYPIALDIALPIYSWAIIENQVGEKRLLNGIRNDMLKDTSIYQPIKPNFYLVKKDHYLHGNYIYEDFTIKTEEVTTTQLEQASTFLKNKIINQELNTIFYQLDSSNLSHYSIQNLKNISK
ncbi:MAG: hypothetical protein IPL21_06995 [Saprospirales bacterium]|nr:hypothetical protein [Saprospirales bacterium]